MELAFTLLARFWKPLLIGVALIALYFGAVGIKHAYDDGKREEGAAPVRAEFEAYKKTAMERTSEITLAWDQKRIEAETAGKVADNERAKRMAESKVRLAALPPAVAAVVVPGRALSLLDDAIRASDPTLAAGPAAAPVESPAAAPVAAPERDGTVGLLTAWGLDVVRLYDACREQVIGWNAFYRGLQAAQVPEP